MSNEAPLGKMQTGEAHGCHLGVERLIPLSLWVPQAPASQGTDSAHTPWMATRLRDPLTQRVPPREPSPRRTWILVMLPGQQESLSSLHENSKTQTEANSLRTV